MAFKKTPKIRYLGDHLGDEERLLLQSLALVGGLRCFAAAAGLAGGRVQRDRGRRYGKRISLRAAIIIGIGRGDGEGKTSRRCSSARQHATARKTYSRRQRAGSYRIAIRTGSAAGTQALRICDIGCRAGNAGRCYGNRRHNRSW